MLLEVLFKGGSKVWILTLVLSVFFDLNILTIIWCTVYAFGILFISTTSSNYIFYAVSFFAPLSAVKCCLICHRHSMHMCEYRK